SLPEEPHYLTLWSDGRPRPSPATRQLLSRRVMVITDHSRNLPCAIFVLPQVNKPAFPDSYFSFMPWMVKAVHAGFKCAVSFHVENLHAHQFSRRLAANVFLDTIGERLLAQREAALIVVELDVIHKE